MKPVIETIREHYDDETVKLVTRALSALQPPHEDDDISVVKLRFLKQLLDVSSDPSFDQITVLNLLYRRRLKD